MMNMKSKPSAIFSSARGITAGMLVQKRTSDADHTAIPAPMIKVKVKYGSSCHEFNISSQASFGDLKNMVAGPTGLHNEEQKLIFKDKERDSRTFLDVAGVIDGSKIVLIENVVVNERRHHEAWKNAQMEKALKDIAEIGLEVDKLAKQVANLETQVFNGKRVVEKTLLNMVEQLMTKLIKLDGIVGDGDVKLKRRSQVKRVQKYIENLDMLKIRNSMIGNIPVQQQQQMKNITVKMQTINPNQKQQEQRQRKHRLALVQPVVATTNQEASGVHVPVAKISYRNSASSVNYGANNTSSRPKWEYFV